MKLSQHPEDASMYTRHLGFGLGTSLLVMTWPRLVYRISLKGIPLWSFYKTQKTLEGIQVTISMGFGLVSFI